MKLVKLSLVAALAAGTFSAANAIPVEEAIKDIDVSGILRYRYDTGRTKKDNNLGFTDSNNNSKQMHKYRAQVNFSSAISDNFKAFVQLDYNAQDGGYGVTRDTSKVIIPNGNNNGIRNDQKGLTVRQLYLTYTNEDVATSVIAGKQQLNTIWTDNDVDGLVGTGVKIVNNSIDGLTLAAFAVDSTNATGEQYGDVGKIVDAGYNFNSNDKNIGTILNWAKNIYGAAAIASYDLLGGQVNSQLWLAYMSDNAFLYALDTAYNTTIFDGINWSLEGAYLGNSLDNKLKDYYKNNGKDIIADGNFFALKGSIEVNGWDASLGGLYYGKKDKATITVIEDQGNLGSLLAGEEIFYTEGSRLNGDIGRNIFGYVTAGYTFNETVRVGADFVYGGTETSKEFTGHNGGKKLEAVARASYKYSPKLSFSTYYSYAKVDQNSRGSDDHNTVRLQALYKF